MSNELIQALQVMTESTLSEVNTMMPGKIISYDAARNRAVVQPIQPKSLANGESLPPPTIAEVPIAWGMGSGGTAGLTAPIKPGDGVMLHFSQRSLEGWLSGNDTAPDDPRRFDLTDAVAVPGLAASGVSANATDVELRFGPVKLRLRPDGGAVLETAGGNLTIDASGRATFSGDVYVGGDVFAGNISLKTHKHLGVQPGGGISGIPTP